MVTHAQASPFPAAPAAPVSPAPTGLLGRFGSAVWEALHAIGAGRARKELTRLAASCDQTNPELAAHLRSVIREDWLTRG